MRKRLIVRSLIGFAIGAIIVHIITLSVNYFDHGQYLICIPGLIDKLGLTWAVIVQTIFGALFGMIAFGGMSFFDIEHWSLLRASMAHCALILVAHLPIGLLLHWFSFNIIPILIMAGIIIVVYTLIWLIMYTIWKIEIRQMNRLAEEYIKETDTSES